MIKYLLGLVAVVVALVLLSGCVTLDRLSDAERQKMLDEREIGPHNGK